jgi:hypothetical protein
MGRSTGNTIMSTAIDLSPQVDSPAGEPLHNDPNQGQGNSFGSGDLSGPQKLTSSLYPFNTDYDPVSPVRFKMRGYYVAGATYESFVVLGAPSNTPPSGHTLINVIIETIF